MKFCLLNSFKGSYTKHIMAKEIDYKRFEVNYKFFHMSYTHQKEKYAGGMGSRNKVITRLFKVFDILLSLLSSILSILKSIFV